MKKLIIYFLPIVVTLLFSCSSDSSTNVTEEGDTNVKTITFTEEQKQMAGIETGKLEKRLVANVIDCTGYIDVPPTNKATIHAPTEGIIQTINVVTGRQVKENAVLATLVDQGIVQIQEQFLDQKSEVDYWKIEFERKQKLYKQDAISKKDFLSTKYEYRQSKYKLESLEKQLVVLGIPEEELIENGISSILNVRAPFHGYISDVFVNIGTYVDEHKPIIEIINYDHVHLELSVYSNDIGKIEIDQLVHFRIAGSEKSGWGKIQLIGKKVDEIDRSVLVHAHIEDGNNGLTIGASIMAEILTKADSAYSLPEEAIIKEGDDSFIYTEQTEGYLKTSVTTGRNYNGFVEILNHPELNNATIVTKGTYYLAE